jgi:hypothetical protein
LSLQGIVPPSLLFHGGVVLVDVGGHATAPAKPCESRVYDSGGVSNLSCGRRSYVPCSSRGYIMACAMFYEQGFRVPSHRFLRLDMHHLTPSGILQMTAFVTLCEDYMGIEPHFNLWNYFFHA